MTEKEQNDLFYVCSLIEYIARKTKNKRKVIVEKLGVENITLFKGILTLFQTVSIRFRAKLKLEDYTVL